MKKLYTLVITCLLLVCGSRTFADVILSTSPVAAANVVQGSDANVFYIVKADVTGSDVTFNRIQFTLTGTHDADDLTTMNLYFNPTSATVSGATLLAINIPATFAAPHAYDFSFNIAGSRTIAAGNSGYFILTVSVDNAGTNGHTIKLNGATNPVTFSYTTSPAVTNNQADAAGLLTIQAGTVSYSTVSSPAANVAQGSSGNVIYIVKADVTAQPVRVTRIQFMLSGTHDADDLSVLNLYYNPTAPTVSGSSVMAVNIPATFAAPHAYDVFFNFTGGQTISAGSSGYFILTVSINDMATDGHTVKVNGAANPVTFTYTTAPDVTNAQTDVAGAQTIQAGTIAYSTVSSPAATVPQGSVNRVAYIVKADVTIQPVRVTRIQFTLTGTFDADDLTTLNLYYNPSAPSLSGSSLMAVNIPATFAAPHAYDVFFNFTGGQTINAGTSGYFILAVSVSNTATDLHTVKVDGAANPVTFTTTLAPNISSMQTDVAGALTIQAGSVTYTSSSVPAQTVAQASVNNVLAIVRITVVNQPIIADHIQFTLSGTHDADDLTYLSIYYNPTAPTLNGSSKLAFVTPATFAAPHAYDVYFNYAGTQYLEAGSGGYFLIVVDISNTATNGNTIKIDPIANPITFTYTTAPNVTNNETDVAGVQTIRAAAVTTSSASIPPATIVRNSTDNVIYAVRVAVSILPIATDHIQFTISGTIDNDDLTVLNLYYNPSSASLAGASPIARNVPATFAAPHAYDVFFNFAGTQNLAPGSNGYFIITVNVDPNATLGNTIKVNGAANPVTFTYTNGPTITNNQTDAAGTKTISSVVPLSLLNFNGNRSNAGDNLYWTTASEINSKKFDVEWSTDAASFTKFTEITAAGSSSLIRNYSVTHTGAGFKRDNYYRLKMIDIDGNFTYSRVIKIAAGAEQFTVKAYPNPFADKLNLEIVSSENKTLTLFIHDASGKKVSAKVFTLIKGINQLSWSVPHLAAGNYYLESNDGTVKAISVKAL